MQKLQSYFIIKANCAEEQGLNLSNFYFIGENRFESDFRKAFLFSTKNDAESALSTIHVSKPSIIEVVEVYKFW